MTDSARCALEGDDASNLGAKQEALDAKSIWATSVERNLQRVKDGTVIMKYIYETRPEGKHIEVGIHLQEQHYSSKFQIFWFVYETSENRTFIHLAIALKD